MVKVWDRSEEDQEAVRIMDLLANGSLTPDRVAAAAGLFFPPAMRVKLQPKRFVGSYRNRLAEAMTSLDHQSIVRFALMCAERCVVRSVERWSQLSPQGKDLTDALILCRKWLEGNDVPIDVPDSIATKLDDQSAAIDHALNGEIGDPLTTAALYAATAAAQAARTLGAALQSPSDEVVLQPWYSASYGASAAARCVDNYLAEIGWQTELLSRLLLGLESR